MAEKQQANELQLSDEAKLSLFEEFRRYLTAAGDGIAGVAASAAETAVAAATSTRAAVAEAAEAVGEAATGAAAFVGRNPGVLAGLVVVPGLALPAAAGVALLTARRIRREVLDSETLDATAAEIVAARKAEEKPAQVIFRVPHSVHVALKQHAAVRDKTIEHVLIVAVLAELDRHGKLERIIPSPASKDG